MRREFHRQTQSGAARDARLVRWNFILDTRLRAAETKPTKEFLKKMLAEAAQRTAELPTEPRS